MSTVDLEAELDAATANVRQPYLDRLRALGVAPAAVANIGAVHPAFGVVEAIGEPTGLYQPGDGELHVINPVFEGGALIDLVAWRSDHPARWYLRTGLGWMLNADACLNGGWDGHLLDLRSSPLDWLRGAVNGPGDAGGVILDWDAPELGSLRCFERIHCSDQWLLATLRCALSKPSRMPSFSLMEVRNAA
jgi:hypothetical protein